MNHDDKIAPDLPPEPENVIEVPVPQVTLTPRALRWIAVALSTALLLIFGAGVAGYFSLRDLQKDNQANIEALRKLTKPTNKEFAESFKEGMKRCRKSKSCRALFPTLQTPKERRITRRREARQAAADLRRELGREQRRRQRIQQKKNGNGPRGGSDMTKPSPPAVRPRPRPTNPPRPGGGNQGGGQSGGGPNPDNKPPLVRTPAIVAPSTPITPTITIPSITVPCQDTPVTKC